MISASDAALMLVSGATENPKYPRQRRRTRMMFKNRLMLATKNLGRLPDQHPVKMATGQGILLLEIEGQGEFQAHAHQVRPVDQNGPERRDGLVQ